MIWTTVNDPERSSFMETNTGTGIKYEMLYARQYMNEEPRGYVLYRIQDNLTQGCIGEINGKLGIVHGLGMACAAGFHPSVIKHTVEELKEMAENDYKNLQSS